MPNVQPCIQAQLGSTVFCMIETYRVVWTPVMGGSQNKSGLHTCEPP